MIFTVPLTLVARFGSDVPPQAFQITLVGGLISFDAVEVTLFAVNIPLIPVDIALVGVLVAAAGVFVPLVGVMIARLDGFTV